MNKSLFILCSIKVNLLPRFWNKWKCTSTPRICLHGLARHSVTFILVLSTAKKLHLKFQLITKRTYIAIDVALFLRIISFTCNNTLFLNRCISRSRYLDLNITAAIWTWKGYWKIGGSIFFGSIPEFSFSTRRKPVKTLHLYSREMNTPPYPHK
jgi:hypothetical protein